jgi:cytosine/adenosine deaminase-related metal-dependent hydrolase
MPAPAQRPRNFIEILQRVWWRLDRALDLETAELSALAGSVEAARMGTTTIVDHHSSPEAIDSSLDAVADGVEAAGGRGIVCFEVTDRNGESSGRRGIAENARFLRANRRTRLRGMMGAHASFTIGPETLESLVGEARDAEAPLHIHLAEDNLDERDSLDRYGVRVGPRLHAGGALREGDLLAHGVCVDAEEIELIKASRAWVAHNPRSNMNNGVGYAPIERLGPFVALGTDGIDGDMFAEARAAYLRAHDANWEAQVLDQLAQGARFAGRLLDEPLLGQLVPGAPADLVVLEYRPPTPLDSSNLLGHYLFGLGAAAVRDVMVGGRWIVRDRRHLLVDEAQLAHRCRAAARTLWERMQLY